MTESWLNEEMKTTDLGDQRLNERFESILEAFAARPNISIPAAMRGRAELEATYRFCDNKNVTPEKILQPHFDATKQRCKHQSIVLCAQDTSELDFSRPQQQVKGAGPLDASSRRGAFLHLNEAFSEDGTPLGAVGAKLWARSEADPEHPKLSKKEKQKQRLSLPIEQKESIRWIEGLRQTQKLAKECPDTLCVSLSDSESDIYELLIEPRTTNNFHWIVRACQDRKVLDEQGVTTGLIRDSLLQQPVLATNEISVRGREQKISCDKSPRRQSRVSRQAMVEVRACAVTIKAPSNRKHSVDSVSVNVVLVREPNPPAGEEPIEWILLTTLPISTLEEVLAVIRYYTVRWMIEIYFRTLKSGCRIEDRRFETIDRMLICTSIYMIVAWRTLFVCRLGRSCPDMPCDLIFDSSEWQSVWSVTHKGESVPEKPPPLSAMVRLIAGLGGYVARGSVALPPGVETVWKGMQRMRDLAWGWETFGPAEKKSE
jgi:hypothetical protein